MRCLAALVAGLLAAPAPAEPSQTVETAEFSIRLPAAAERSEHTVPTAAGDLQVITWLLATDDAAVALMYSDAPAGAEQPPPEETLDRARQGALAKAQAELVREEKVTLEGPGGKRWPGRTFTGRSDQGVAYDCTIYLVGRRLYQLIAVHRAEEPIPPAHAEMVASLRLKPAS